MRQMKSVKSVKRQQGGFTLIEVIIAIVVGLVIIAGAAYILGGSQDDARANATKEFFLSQVPAAVQSYVSISGSLDGLAFASSPNTVAKPILEARGLKPTTPWNAAWTVGVITVGDTDFDIVFPIGGAAPDELGGILQAALDAPAYPHITNAVYASGNLTVTIKAF